MKNRSIALFIMAVAALGLTVASRLAEGQSVPQRRAIPRTTDGKPDFTGVWAGPGFTHKVGPNDTDAPSVTQFDPKKMSPFRPGGEALMNRPLTDDVLLDDPTAVCLPNGIPRQLLSPYAQQWIHAPGHIVILYEYMHFFRVIPTDGRPHAKDIEPTWMGDSVAKWEGDTLVIDTVGLKEWVLDATHNEKGSRWHSDALHTIERLRYVDPMTVSYQITIDDPKIFTAHWTQDFQMKLHPTWKLYEFVCEENDRCRAGKCSESPAQRNSQ